jgi:hypothetical protein
LVTIGALPGKKQMILDQLPDFTLISGGFFEHFQMGSGHGARGKNPKWRFTKLQETALVCVRRTEVAVEVKGALGFSLTHGYVAAGVIWACMFHSTLPEIIECTNGPQQHGQLF